MAAGFDLKEGEYDQTLKSSKEIRENLNLFFENSTVKASTYKYAMFKSIMDCLNLTTNKTYRISFDLLFSRFAEIYWVLVFQHKIPQKPPSINAPETLAERVISRITEKYRIRRKTKYADLPDRIRSELVDQMKNNCSRYVFGALYAETDQMLYSFSKEKEWIKVNPQIVYFLGKHGNTIQKQNYQAWGNYYVKIDALSGKDSGFYQRLLKRELGDNTVLPIGQQVTTKKASNKKNNAYRTNDAVIANKIRSLMSKYPDLGLYLKQVCEISELDKDIVKQILENSFWCRKEGSRYYYVDVSDSDLIGDVLFQEEIPDDNETIEDEMRESDLESDAENIMLLSDPEELIKKLKQEKGIAKQIEPEQIKDVISRKTQNSRMETSSKGSKRAEWDREEVVILVTEYYRTKYLPLAEIMVAQQKISEFLRKREEIINGKPLKDTFRNPASIYQQFSKLRATDPYTGYSKKRGTKIQKEVMKEYLENPEMINGEAEEIYRKYNGINEKSITNLLL